MRGEMSYEKKANIFITMHGINDRASIFLCDGKG